MTTLTPGEYPTQGGDTATLVHWDADTERWLGWCRSYVYWWDADGCLFECPDHSYNLVIPPKVESRWLNVYKENRSTFWRPSRAAADESASSDRICVLREDTYPGSDKPTEVVVEWERDRL